MAQQPILDALYTKFAADTAAGGVSTLTGARMYEVEGPDDAALPLLLWTPVSDIPVATFGNDGFDAEYQFDVFGDGALGPKPVRTINDAIWTLLNRKTLTVTGYGSATVACTERGVETREGRAIRIRSQYRIKAMPQT